jgi:hypothetical protein
VHYIDETKEKVTWTICLAFSNSQMHHQTTKIIKSRLHIQVERSKNVQHYSIQVAKKIALPFILLGHPVLLRRNLSSIYLRLKNNSYT